MPLINLMPPPAFEKSLVPAFQTNFNRIRDAFVRTSNRIYMDATQLNGGWPKSYAFTHPFKADIQVNWGASFYVGGIGPAGVALYMDGVACPNWAIMFHNEPSSHRYLSTSTMVRGVDSGLHTWTIQHVLGSATSDSGDYANLGFILQEVLT